jgi:intracellular sulfur oxidation DsrE/DsrF family protein
MYKKKLTSLLVLLICSAAIIAQPKVTFNRPVNVVAGSEVKHHIVMQVSTKDTLAWFGLMNNIKHLKETWGEAAEIEVVAHGPGIELLMIAKTTQQLKISELKNAGIVFAACMNTMKSRNLSKTDILPDAIFVPSGVVEIVTKEEAGWSYLKSGF